MNKPAEQTSIIGSPELSSPQQREDIQTEVNRKRNAVVSALSPEDREKYETVRRVCAELADAKIPCVLFPQLPIGDSETTSSRHGQTVYQYNTLASTMENEAGIFPVETLHNYYVLFALIHAEFVTEITAQEETPFECCIKGDLLKNFLIEAVDIVINKVEPKIVQLP